MFSKVSPIALRVRDSDVFRWVADEGNTAEPVDILSDPNDRTGTATHAGVKASQRTPISIACSKQADAKNLHGKERQKFRAACMNKG